MSERLLQRCLENFIKTLMNVYTYFKRFESVTTFRREIVTSCDENDPIPKYFSWNYRAELCDRCAAFENLFTQIL